MPMRNSLKDERGFTMIMTTIGLSMVALIALVAVTAVSGDINPTGRDLQRKRAYEAAKAGINDYSFHLHNDNGYWAKCTKVDRAQRRQPAGLDDKPAPGSRRRQRHLRDRTAARQRKPDLRPDHDRHRDPDACSSRSARRKGTFRIRSTGFVGKAQVSITATFRPSSFLDYVYFTQLETSDPVTYGSEAAIKGAYEQCSKTLLEGRNNAKIPNSEAVLPGDLLRQRRLDQRAAAHQRLPGRSAANPPSAGPQATRSR